MADEFGDVIPSIMKAMMADQCVSDIQELYNGRLIWRCNSFYYEGYDGRPMC